MWSRSDTSVTRVVFWVLQYMGKLPEDRLNSASAKIGFNDVQVHWRSKWSSSYKYSRKNNSIMDMKSCSWMFSVFMMLFQSVFISFSYLKCCSCSTRGNARGPLNLVWHIIWGHHLWNTKICVDSWGRGSNFSFLYWNLDMLVALAEKLSYDHELLHSINNNMQQNSQDISHRTKSANLMGAPKESLRITRGINVYPLGTINVCTKCHGN